MSHFHSHVAFKKFDSIESTIMQNKLFPHESQYRNHRFLHQNRINGDMCQCLRLKFSTDQQRVCKESGESFLFKTTGDTWEQIYVRDKNGQTFIVGSWAIKLDLLVHSHQHEHFCGVGLTNNSPEAASWGLNGAGKRQGSQSLDDIRRPLFIWSTEWGNGKSIQASPVLQV